MLDQILDLVARIATEEEYLTPSQVEEIVEQEQPTDSYREKIVVGKLLETMGKVLNSKENQENAYNEAVLYGNKGKHEFMGNSLTLKTNNVYDYPDDQYINKCEVEAQEKQQEIQPILDEIKGLEQSKKQRQKTLVKENKATVTETKKQISVSK